MTTGAVDRVDGPRCAIPRGSYIDESQEAGSQYRNIDGHLTFEVSLSARLAVRRGAVGGECGRCVSTGREPRTGVTAIHSRTVTSGQRPPLSAGTDQGSMTLTPVSSKSLTLRVTRNAPRERDMAAIWQSASPIGRPAWRRPAAISA